LTLPEARHIVTGTDRLGGQRRPSVLIQ